ncbi:Piso0_000504 [Millerozyma farinosa CBS 7064]|uniref:Piso0_000504 protein n=1 Tax=Pichia sorbitophila (strain ATCC MYA-4447 / BCRC 22081 / CBS 7064 / NBRC 10061 / NRRL Y-12695) TaxID=559304 RepID=G8YVL8_PICSO|nr:Piso0_000504 [Millerozyma farinosa CBS 7064]CCE73462.1 Piso0_000504 [Millerozyma farinosa CBS 7064]
MPISSVLALAVATAITYSDVPRQRSPTKISPAASDIMSITVLTPLLVPHPDAHPLVAPPGTINCVSYIVAALEWSPHKLNSTHWVTHPSSSYTVTRLLQYTSWLCYPVKPSVWHMFGLSSESQCRFLFDAALAHKKFSPLPEPVL